MNTLHENVRRFFRLLRAPLRSEGFRTMAQWRALKDSFARWPSFRVAQSDKVAWVSCCRCKRPSPRACMRNWCFHCSDGQPFLYGEAMEREHAGSFDTYDTGQGWWERLPTPLLDALEQST